MTMDDLIAFLRAQLDEDERVAREASPGPWAKARADSVYVKETSVVTRPPTPEANRPEWVGPFDYVVMPDSEGGEGIEPTDAEHIARWDPARVLAEVEAKRRMLDMYADADHLQRVGWENDEPSKYEYMAREEALGKVIKLLAKPYAGREGWREEWRAN